MLSNALLRVLQNSFVLAVAVYTYTPNLFLIFYNVGSKRHVVHYYFDCYILRNDGSYRKDHYEIYNN